MPKILSNILSSMSIINSNFIYGYIYVYDDNKNKNKNDNDSNNNYKSIEMTIFKQYNNDDDHYDKEFEEISLDSIVKN